VNRANVLYLVTKYASYQKLVTKS